MYTNYKILFIDTTESMVVFKFTKEDTRDFVTRKYYDGELTEEKLSEMVKSAQYESYNFHLRDTQSAPFTPENWEGTLKSMNVEDCADYDPTSHKAEEVREETDSEINIRYTLTEFSVSEKASHIRRRRDSLLRGTDNYGFSDRAMPDEIKAYREALRDITDQEGFPESVSWPLEPSQS
jgi:hypothetical protein